MKKCFFLNRTPFQYQAQRKEHIVIHCDMVKKDLWEECPLNVLCFALALSCIAITRFSAGFTSFPGHLILTAWPWYNFSNFVLSLCLIAKNVHELFSNNRSKSCPSPSSKLGQIWPSLELGPLANIGICEKYTEKNDQIWPSSKSCL